MTIRQLPVPTERLQRGIPDISNRMMPGVNTALVGQEPAEIAQRLGVRFDESFDDLDYLDIALLQIDQDTEFALVRHRGMPGGGTEIWMHTEDWNRPEVLSRVLAELGIAADELLWRLPLDFPVPPPRKPEMDA
jgi:hypothetical protein